MLCLTDFYNQTGLAGQAVQLRPYRACSAGSCADSQACFLVCQVGRTRRERWPRFPSTSSCGRRCGCRGCFGASAWVLSVPSEQHMRLLTEPPLLARPSRLPLVSEAEERAVNPPLRRPRPCRGLSAKTQAVEAVDSPRTAAMAVAKRKNSRRRPGVLSARFTSLASGSPPFPFPGPRPAPPVPR